ncbi:hypothetical protein [Salisaeta longa]|uniref:hypothetical protein n=1 Tax=Salisaeta longa TaxID=503170 RepID=UPI0003B38BAF|nr:hypothetical protein [Salisaeta longa]
MINKFAKIGSFLAALLLLVGVFSTAQAQMWQSSAKVIVPVADIEDGYPTRALLDTLISRFQSVDSLKVYRTSDKEEKVSISELESELIDQGFALSSANSVQIGYKFRYNQGNFSETITDLYFVYRPQGTGQEDIPIMYLDAQRPIVKSVLENSGTQNQSNPFLTNIFADQLAFARIARTKEDATVVQVAGRDLRSEDVSAREKRQLVQRILDMAYGRM